MSTAESEMSAQLYVEPALLDDILNGLRPKLRVTQEQLLLGLACLDFIVTAGAMFGAALTYHIALMGELPQLGLYGAIATCTALAFGCSAAVDNQYCLARLQSARANAIRAVRTFNVVFAILVCGLFLTHVTDTYSRGTLVLQYGAVTVALIMSRLAVVWAFKTAARRGLCEAQKVGVIGPRKELQSFVQRIARERGGCGVAAAFELPTWALEPNDAAAQLELERFAMRLSRSVRSQALDEVVIAVPWKAHVTIAAVAKAIGVLPCGVRLLAEQEVFCRHGGDMLQIGGNRVISLQNPPQSVVSQLTKRAFDVAVAASALIVAAPIFALIAIAIKSDSRGPVIFRQQRHGLNRTKFFIRKFRTMTTTDDGDVIEQARICDPRVTRVGRMLRRSSLDELPQLFDVLQGTMSIVGPRPHAVAHDRLYEERIPSYVRRHAIKPGLTGWAQVNGFRGETECDWKMEKRIEHDLVYIENASLLFDIQILILTVFSARAFKNAY